MLTDRVNSWPSSGDLHIAFGTAVPDWVSPCPVLVRIADRAITRPCCLRFSIPSVNLRAQFSVSPPAFRRLSDTTVISKSMQKYHESLDRIIDCTDRLSYVKLNSIGISCGPNDKGAGFWTPREHTMEGFYHADSLGWKRHRKLAT